MKIYSDDVVTKSDLTSTDTKQSKQIEKLTKQLTQLRGWLALAFLVNLGATAAVWFLK